MSKKVHLVMSSEKLVAAAKNAPFLLCIRPSGDEVYEDIAMKTESWSTTREEVEEKEEEGSNLIRSHCHSNTSM